MPSVLFFAPSAYPLGGLATWLDYLVPGLQALGWSVQLGLGSGRWHDVDAYLAAHPGLPVVRVGNPTGSREGRVRAIAKAVRAAKPDLVAGVNIPDACAAVERPRLRGEHGPRVVATIHGIEPDLFEDVREYRELLDGVLCTNRLACGLAAADGGMDPARVHHVPYGVELPEQPRREPGGAALRILFAGRLEESQKRVSDLARVAETLAGGDAPFLLSIAGEGPDGPELRARLAPLVGRGLVRFLGAVPHAEVQERLYPETDVLLLTSSWETGPIVVWEAMAGGVAVASTRYLGSGLEGALEHGVNSLLFDVGDAQGAAACLRSLGDAALRGRVAAAGRALVAERYTIARSVAGWAQAMERVLASPRRDAPRARRAPVLSGRLDRWLGPGPAETVRRLAGVSFAHGEPGGEWPHSYGRRRRDDPGFRQLATALDRGGCGRGGAG